MAEYKEDFITVNGVKLHYYRGGKGEKTVVLLHGATDNAMCWKPVADKLIRDYDVVMPDAQGHGLSDRLQQGFEFADHAAQIAGLIKALEIDKPVIGGHSMGGSTATNIAGLYPDIPGGIVLEDPGWMAPPPAAGQPPAANNDFAKTSIEMTKKSLEDLVDQCRKENPLWSEEEIRPWAEAKKQYDTNLFSFLKINQSPYDEMVAKITCPVLLFTSEGGIVTDDVVRQAMELYTADSEFRHVKVMGAGHNIRREKFSEFYSAMTGFITNL